MRREVTAVILSTLSCVTAACGAPGSPPPGRLSLAVAALNLPDVGGACYDVRVANGEDQLLWSLGDPGRRVPSDDGALCSQDLGTGDGGLTWFGPCDGASPQTTVTLYLDSLWASGADRNVDPPLTGWVNPCPSPTGCVVTTTCNPGGDASAVFELTVLRESDQGFFDISVGLDEVFCTAQVDCEKNGQFGPEPLNLLHDPLTGQRVPSVAMRFACTAGAERDTHLLLDAELRCGATTVRLPLGRPEGNAYSALTRPPPLVQAASYRGLDQTTTPLGEGTNLLFFNTVVALDFNALDDMCHLWAKLSATAGRPSPAFSPPTATAYPVLNVYVPLAGPGALSYSCARSRIGSGPPEGVWVVSTSDPESFRFLAYELDAAIAVETRPEYRLQFQQVSTALRAESANYSLTITSGQSSPIVMPASSESYDLRGGIMSQLTEQVP